MRRAMEGGDWGDDPSNYLGGDNLDYGHYSAVGNWRDRHDVTDPYDEIKNKDERERLRRSDYEKKRTALKGGYYADKHGNIYNRRDELIYVPSENDRKLDYQERRHVDAPTLRDVYEGNVPTSVKRYLGITPQQPTGRQKVIKRKMELPPGEDPYAATPEDIEAYRQAHPLAMPTNQDPRYDLPDPTPVQTMGGSGGGGGMVPVPLIPIVSNAVDERNRQTAERMRQEMEAKAHAQDVEIARQIRINRSNEAKGQAIGADVAQQAGIDRNVEIRTYEDMPRYQFGRGNQTGGVWPEAKVLIPEGNDNPPPIEPAPGPVPVPAPAPVPIPIAPTPATIQTGTRQVVVKNDVKGRGQNEQKDPPLGPAIDQPIEDPADVKVDRKSVV